MFFEDETKREIVYTIRHGDFPKDLDAYTFGFWTALAAADAYVAARGPGAHAHVLDDFRTVVYAVRRNRRGRIVAWRPDAEPQISQRMRLERAVFDRANRDARSRAFDALACAARLRADLLDASRNRTRRFWSSEHQAYWAAQVCDRLRTARAWDAQAMNPHWPIESATPKRT